MSDQVSAGVSRQSDACADAETWQQFSHGLLEDDLSERLSNHLDHCPKCLELVSNLVEESDTIVNLFDDWGVKIRQEKGLKELTQLAHARELTRWSLPSSDLSTGESPAVELPPVLDEYELLEPLGAGAVGHVYKAVHRRLHKTVALKILAPKRGFSDELIDRFSREMQAVGKISSPHVIAATDARRVDGFYVLVMEYAAGIDVSRLLTRVERIPVPEACEIVRQAALGIAAAHQHSFIHRDVKPSNLLLTREGIVKVLDLGLVKLERIVADEQQPEGNNVVGTPHYMAPEQWRGESIDARTDIYGLGCTLYRLITGRLIYREEDSARLSYAHQKFTIPAISDVVGDVPADLERLFHKCVAKSREERPASAQELAEQLEPLARGADLTELLRRSERRSLSETLSGNEDITAKLPRANIHTPGRRNSWIRYLITVAASFGLLAFAGAMWLGGDDGRQIPAWEIVTPPDTIPLWREAPFPPEVTITSTNIELRHAGISFLDIGESPDRDYALETSIEPQLGQRNGLFFGAQSKDRGFLLFSVWLKKVREFPEEDEYDVQVYCEHYKPTEGIAPRTHKTSLDTNVFYMPKEAGRIPLRVQISESGPLRISAAGKHRLDIAAAKLRLFRHDFQKGQFGLRSEVDPATTMNFLPVRILDF